MDGPAYRITRPEARGQVAESGLSLVATLWIMAVLSILATEYLYTVYLERKMGDNLVERTQLEYAAKAGIAQFTRLIARDETGYDALQEEWAKGIDGELEDPLVSNKVYSYRVEATDENARINVNTADEALLERVLALTGRSPEEYGSLPPAIVQAREERPFRTLGDLARVEGMTAEILYGTSSSGEAEGSEGEENEIKPLINLITVYSVDKNVQSDGSSRTNIATADANALRQGLTDANGNPLLSQAEAEAIVAFRQEKPFDSIGQLWDVPAVTQSVLDGARDQLSTEDEENKVNINTADRNELANVNGFDEGTAEDVIRHRQENGNYGSVDEIRDAKVFTRDEIKQVIDKVTVKDDTTIVGLLNINTASQEILALLPNMDENKARAIVEHRDGTGGGSGPGGRGPSPTGEAAQGNPFTTVGDLLDVPAIDEETFKQIAGLVTYRSQVFRVEASGMGTDEKALARIVAVLDRSGARVRARYWMAR